ncbi:MAG: Ribose-phosphate pyrophosphokinase, partial [uncultured Gemmatimonadetes bacterium]
AGERDLRGERESGTGPRGVAAGGDAAGRVQRGEVSGWRNLGAAAGVGARQRRVPAAAHLPAGERQRDGAVRLCRRLPPRGGGAHTRRASVLRLRALRQAARPARAHHRQHGGAADEGLRHRPRADDGPSHHPDRGLLSRPLRHAHRRPHPLRRHAGRPAGRCGRRLARCGAGEAGDRVRPAAGPAPGRAPQAARERKRHARHPPGGRGGGTHLPDHRRHDLHGRNAGGERAGPARRRREGISRGRHARAADGQRHRAADGRGRPARVRHRHHHAAAGRGRRPARGLSGGAAGRRPSQARLRRIAGRAVL